MTDTQLPEIQLDPAAFRHLADAQVNVELDTGELPDFLPALARFEWTDFAVYTSMEPVPERVERLTVNPTLAVLEHPFQLCAHVRRQGRGAPEPGQEMALLWRHPERLVTMYLAANDRSLLASTRALAERVSIVGGKVVADVPYVALDSFETDTLGRIYYKVTGLHGETVSGYDDLPAVPASVPMIPVAAPEHPLAMAGKNQPGAGRDQFDSVRGCQ